MGGSWVERARSPIPLLRPGVRGHAARRSKDLPEDERATQAHSVANQKFASHWLRHPGGSDAVAGDPGCGDGGRDSRLGPYERCLQDLHGDRLNHRRSWTLLRSDASLLRGNLLLKEARLCLTATRGGGLQFGVANFAPYRAARINRCGAASAYGV